jgi:hypothetical protein
MAAQNSRHSELALVLVRLNHVARGVGNADRAGCGDSSRPDHPAIKNDSGAIL